MNKEELKEYCKLSSEQICKQDYELRKLHQENQRLNENNQSMQEEIVRTWEISDDYKSRNKKAIEYIENDLQSYLYSIEYKKLLDILKGVK